jgi:hypothetical protein
VSRRLISPAPVAESSGVADIGGLGVSRPTRADLHLDWLGWACFGHERGLGKQEVICMSEQHENLEGMDDTWVGWMEWLWEDGVFFGFLCAHGYANLAWTSGALWG